MQTTTPLTINMPEGFTRWDSADILKSEEDMQLYLEACFDEDEGDGALIRKGLGVIARARGMTQLAKDTGLTREGLYTALSTQGNPSFSTVAKVTRALGMRLHSRALAAAA
jgi:probable addiction module antidote protein